MIYKWKQITKSILFIIISFGCSHQKSTKNAKGDNKTVEICAADLASYGQKVKYTGKKKEVKGKCKFLGKVKVDFCSASEYRKAFHLNGLKNLVGLKNGNTLYARSLKSSNRKGKVVGYAFKCNKNL